MGVFCGSPDYNVTRKELGGSHAVHICTTSKDFHLVNLISCTLQVNLGVLVCTAGSRVTTGTCIREYRSLRLQFSVNMATALVEATGSEAMAVR